MKINFGYAALSKTLNITSSKTISYTNYLKLPDSYKNQKLNDLIKQNLENLMEILIYNKNNNIYFYRMTSSLFPLFNHPLVDYDYFIYKKEMKKIGNFIKKHKMRINIHPSQFCVLNSTKKEVVDSSINMLKLYQKMFKFMELDGLMIIHIGSGTFGKEKSLTRFINNFNKLDESLKRMIALENDDKVFNIKDTLKLCQILKIPMVLDVHHYNCNNEGEQIEEYIEKIFKTWENKVPKIHFSSPKSQKEKRSHHDYIDINSFISFISKIKFINQDFDIMIEAKAKDEALFNLIRLIKYKKYGYFEENTLILK